MHNIPMAMNSMATEAMAMLSTNAKILPTILFPTVKKDRPT